MSEPRQTRAFVAFVYPLVLLWLALASVAPQTLASPLCECAPGEVCAQAGSSFACAPALQTAVTAARPGWWVQYAALDALPSGGPLPRPLLSRAEPSAGFVSTSAPPVPELPLGPTRVVWSGQLTVLQSGTYTFSFQGSEGASLAVGEAIATSTGGPSLLDVALVAGQPTTAQFSMTDQFPPLSASIQWRPPGATAFAPIPSTVVTHQAACGAGCGAGQCVGPDQCLCPPTHRGASCDIPAAAPVWGGLARAMFDNPNQQGPVVTATSAALEVTSGLGPPAPGLGAGTWSAAWRGLLSARPGAPDGWYTLRFSTSHAVSVRVDGAVVARTTGARSASAGVPVFFGAGVVRALEVDFEVSQGSAQLVAQWEGPGFSLEKIPLSALAARPEATDCAACSAPAGDCGAFCALPAPECVFTDQGGFGCVCPRGASGAPGSCRDLDECSGSAACSSNSACTNLPGSHHCAACAPGAAGFFCELSGCDSEFGGACGPEGTCMQGQCSCAEDHFGAACELERAPSGQPPALRPGVQQQFLGEHAGNGVFVVPLHQRAASLPMVPAVSAGAPWLPTRVQVVTSGNLRAPAQGNYQFRVVGAGTSVLRVGGVEVTSASQAFAVNSAGEALAVDWTLTRTTPSSAQLEWRPPGAAQFSVPPSSLWTHTVGCAGGCGGGGVCTGTGNGEGACACAPGLSGAQCGQACGAVQSGALRRFVFSDAQFGQLHSADAPPGVSLAATFGPPVAGAPSDGFSLRYLGWITPPTTGWTSFFGVTDAYLGLWVAGVPVLPQAETSSAPVGEVFLEAGVPVPIRVDYRDLSGPAELALQWAPPGFSRQGIDPAALSFAPAMHSNGECGEPCALPTSEAGAWLCDKATLLPGQSCWFEPAPGAACMGGGLRTCLDGALDAEVGCAGCLPGFEQTANGDCTDVDECVQGAEGVECGQGSVCVNRPGGYDCVQSPPSPASATRPGWWVVWSTLNPEQRVQQAAQPTLDVPLTSAAPLPHLGSQPFRVVGRAEVWCAQAGVYALRLRGTGPASLHIDGAAVLTSAGQLSTASLALEAGPHAFRVEAAKVSATFELTLEWSPPGLPGFAPIPPELVAHQVSCAGGCGLGACVAPDVCRCPAHRTGRACELAAGAPPVRGEAVLAAFASAESAAPAWVGTSAGLGANFGFGPPAPGVSPDFFAARWRAFVELPAGTPSGWTVFRVEAAGDSAALYLDGVEVAPLALRTAAHPIPVYLEAGVLHSLALDFVDTGGAAAVSVTWQPPGQPEAAIAPQQLSRRPEVATASACDACPAALAPPCGPHCTSPQPLCALGPGGAECGCPGGFVAGPLGCQDLDECAGGSHTCEPPFDCTNTPGGHHCASCAAPFGGFSCALEGCAAEQTCSGQGTCDDGQCFCAPPAFGGDCELGCGPEALRPGLVVDYFNDAALQNLVATQVSRRIGADYGFGSALPGLPADSFSVRWRGSLRPRHSGAYRFLLTADNSASLFVDDKPVVTIDPLSLQGGQPVALELRFVEGTGLAAVDLRWRPPGAADWEPIPDDVLVHAPQCAGGCGASGCCVGGGACACPAGVVAPGCDPSGAAPCGPLLPGGLTAWVAPNLTWSSPVAAAVEVPGAFNTLGNIHPQLTADNFSVRWRGWLHPPLSGWYRFFVETDSFAALHLHGLPVIFPADLGGTRMGEVFLQAGVAAPIQMEYRDQAGIAAFRVRWEGPGFAARELEPTVLSTAAWLLPSGACGDACASAPLTCGANASCASLGGFASCVCNPGYAFVGGQCAHVDECAAPINPCGDHGECVDLDGSYACTCEPCYTEAGGTCVFAGCALSLDAVTPAIIEPAAHVELHLTGAGFSGALEVYLADAAATEVVVLSPTALVARVKAPSGTAPHDVTVLRTKPDGGVDEATLTSAVAISVEVCGALQCETCTDHPACFEGDRCTQDRCNGGLCEHTQAPACCPPEGCNVCALNGDLTADETTSVTDVMCEILLSLWFAGDNPGPMPTCLLRPAAMADLNCDGAIDVSDVVLQIQHGALEQPLPTAIDANADGCVDTCVP